MGRTYALLNIEFQRRLVNGKHLSLTGLTFSDAAGVRGEPFGRQRQFGEPFGTQIRKVSHLAIGRKTAKPPRMKTLILALLTLAAAACAPAQQATPAAPTPAFKTTANVKQLMTAIVIPSSDILFEMGSKPPADEAGWMRVQNAAVSLAESGNLLMIGDRSKPEKEWADFSRAMIDAGQLALKAADKKNVDEVLAAGDKIYETCDNCHQKYMDKTK